MRFYILMCCLVSVWGNAYAHDLFVFKKNHNPNNVLHYSVHVSKQCTFMPFNDGSYVSAYWIMGEEDGQREPINKLERKVYAPVVSNLSSNQDSFEMTFSAVQEIEAPNFDPTITVKTEKSQTGCRTWAQMTVDGQEMSLNEFYIEGKFNLLMSWKTHFLLITGVNHGGSIITKKVVP